MKQSGWSGMLVASVMLGSCSPGAAVTDDGDLPVLVRSSIRTNASLQALAQGTLHLDRAGCLRIGEGGPFVIWPYDSRVSRTAEGLVQVTDGLSGQAIDVGQEFAVAGAGVDVPPTELREPIPPACATGRFWLAGPVMSEADRLAVTNRR
ncbi:hypothetical protein [Brevundimonas sp. GCM10030266]|uniref:hypothetical protein n=1 Tax=Brevundimonas sp. GCM10030266 TaxID=3273386 RepID=UPI00360A3CCA